MKNLLSNSFKYNDFLLIALFFLSVIPFVGSQIAAESLIPLKSSVIGLLWLHNARFSKSDRLTLLLVLFCLAVVYLLHDCGIGAILNLLNMYILLLSIPYIRVSKYTFTVLGIACLGLCYIQYQYITTHFFSLFEKGNLNANSVGLFTFFSSALALLFFTNTDGWVLKIISFVTVIFVYPVLLMTYCRSATLAYTCLIAFYCIYLIPKVRIFFYKRSVYVRTLGVVLIVFNIVFVLLACYTNLNEYLSVFLENSEIKNTALSDRHYIWRHVLALYVDDPIFGIGNHIQTNIDGPRGTAVLHNSFLAFLVYYGIIVYVCTVNIIRRSYIRLFRNNQYDLSTMLVPIFMICVFLVATFETVLLQEFMLFSVLPLIFAENKYKQDLMHIV